MGNKVKLNGSEEYEPIMIKLDKANTPIAYKNKIDELVEEGAYESAQEAEADNPYFEIDCEIYYDKHNGVFAVESDAVESSTIYSPYSGVLCEEYKEV